MSTLNDSIVKKLPFGAKLGYGAAAASDSIAYEFVAAFLLFFLTDIAGVDPVFGGMIVSIAVLWDAITDPIIGNLSDRTRTRIGRRRPWLAASIVPLMASMIFLFTTFPLAGGAENGYYLAVALVFWTAYTAFCIPYYALGPTLTNDYADRTVMRAIGQICQYVGVFCSMALPTMLVQMKLDSGASAADAWQFAAIILAILAGIFILITVLSTKGRDIVESSEASDERKTNIFKDCLEILKIRAFRINTLAALLYRVGYAFSMSASLYFIIYNAGLTEGDSSIYYASLSIGGIIFTSILAKFGIKFEKKYLIIGTIGFTGIVMIIFRFVTIDSVPMLVLFAALYTVGSASFWTLMLSLVYDISEIDEFRFGKRREGTIFSFYLFCNKLGYAVSAMVAGSLLSWSGYDANAAEQTPEALGQINNMFTIYPGISMILCVLVVCIYPVTQDKYQALMVQLGLKREGKEYNDEGFEILLK